MGGGGRHPWEGQGSDGEEAPPIPPILDNPEGGENLFGKAGKTPFSGHRYNNVFI